MTDNFIDDFIKEYQNQPCLWQASCPDFKNRRKRQDAYLKLIDVATKHGETYNIERTKQKINNLRCAFRVQLKKYMDFKSNPTKNRKEEYLPKRKYMDNLMFLINEEKPLPRRRKSSTNESDDSNIPSKQRKRPVKDLNSITLSLESETEEVEPQKNENSTHINVQINVENGNLLTVKNKQNSNANCNETLENHEELKTDTIKYQITNDKDDITDIGTTDNSNIFWTKPVSSAPAVVTTTKFINSDEIKKNPMQGQIVQVRTVKQPNIKKIGPIVSSPTTNQSPSITVLEKSPKPSTFKLNSTPQREDNSFIINKPIVSTTNTDNNVSQKNKGTCVTSSSPINKIQCSQSNFEKLLSLACSRMNQIADTEDDFGIFGKFVTSKLRGMDTNQALLAQRQISQILFDGKMNLLQQTATVQQQSLPVLQTQPLQTTTIRRSGERTYIISGLNGNNLATTNEREQYNSLPLV